MKGKSQHCAKLFSNCKIFRIYKKIWKNMRKIYIPQPNLRNKKVGASLVVQWLRFHAPKAGGLGWIQLFHSSVPHDLGINWAHVCSGSLLGISVFV